MASMQLEKPHEKAESIKAADAAGSKEVNKASAEKKTVIHDKAQDAQESSKHGQLMIKHAQESELTQHAKVGISDEKKKKKKEKEKKEEKKKPAKASHKMKEEKEKKEKKKNKHKDGSSSSSEGDSDGHENKKKLAGKKFK